MRRQIRILVIGFLAATALTCVGFALWPVLRTYHLIRVLESGTASERLSSAHRLGELKSAFAIDPLCRVVEEATADPNPDFRQNHTIHYAARALVKIGEPAIPRILELARHKSPRTREQAAFAFGSLEAPSEVVVPVLVELLDDPMDYVSQVAAQSLGKLGNRAREAVPRLIQLLDRTNANHYEICHALTKIHPQESDVAALCRLLESPRGVGNELCNVADVLGTMGDDAQVAVPALCAAIDEKRYVASAVRALARIRATPESVVPAIISAVKHAGALDYSARDSKWERSMADQSRRIKGAVTDYFKLLGLRESGALPYLEKALREDRSEWTRKAIVEVLGLLGTEARDAIPLLEELRRTGPFPQLRQASEAALEKIEDK